jgi:hypothetical protein
MYASISKSARENIPNQKTKNLISKKLKGRKFTKKHKDNLSKAMLGNKNGKGYIL